MAGLIKPDTEIRDLILEYGGEEALKCYQCGMCTSLCPWYQVEGIYYPVNTFSTAVRLGNVLNTEEKEEIAREVTEMYRCVGCEACLGWCPRGLSTPLLLRAVRRILVENQSIPAPLKSAIAQLTSAGNPLAGDPDKRHAWAGEEGLPAFEEGMDLAWFTCCTADYDPRCQAIGRATLKLLNKAGLTFGAFGAAQQCCGEAIRRAGAEATFQSLAKANAKLLSKAAGSEVLVNSPHCLIGFRRDYPELGTEPKAIHSSQLLARLIAEEKLKPKKELGKKVTYHDPCTLGRQSGVYEEPRQVLRSIPGLELVEIEDFNRENAVCCGGGGGGIWLEWPKGERLADIRVKQAAATGAEILAVACPYCLQMFEDSVKTTGVELEVKDITELLADSLEPIAG
ncbi:(Fe-S)-binding protein [candidate division WOR-3 bacterium]|nr:(Fe-S)-binding protein [candidate division WOR-3 bacterium]